MNKRDEMCDNIREVWRAYAIENNTGLDKSDVQSNLHEGGGWKHAGWAMFACPIHFLESSNRP